ncbi:hypothetical protein QJS04_geneDACA001036 [Acorus gramineus]|uniref:Oxidoreductase-like domain-containing protein n=1 Tax=Acorus gramineus TaxID=55184 RepID=A0AAV9ABU7_ACOGR|nr:hypothetical protein QJS04_geneDACA001036 [Acorus gramineus]
MIRLGSKSIPTGLLSQNSSSSRLPLVVPIHRSTIKMSKSKEESIIEEEEEEEKKKKRDEASKVPSPPEKPLPGDCCGSGCVRCVWDIYYDELEAYNSAIETHNKTNHGEIKER